MTPEGCPENLLEAIRYFADPQVAHDFMVGMRWENGVRCPICKGANVSFYSNRRIYRCTSCKKQFTLKTGTVFEDSPLGLDKWLPCVWLIVNAKNGVSSCEIARALTVTQKTAWFMLHRVRAALKVGNFEKMAGVVEADESWIGGDAEFMHKKVKKAKGIGRGKTNKTIVMGLLAHGEVKGASKVRHKIIKDTDPRDVARRDQGTRRGRVRPFTRTRGSPTGVLALITRTSSLTMPSSTSAMASTRTVWRTSGACSSGRSRARMSTSTLRSWKRTLMNRLGATMSAS